MESKSLQINGNTWIVTVLGEQALILKPEMDEIPVSLIHEATRILEKADIPKVVDLIPAYENIALIYGRLLENPGAEIQKLEKKIQGQDTVAFSPQKHEVPVCYELGLDWEEVENKTGLSQSEIIKKHQEPVYTVAMMGFVPGFVYLSSMEEAISCPRKENPRIKIPAGSVGIGGNQTGIYSLESPGGWQIIGRTPQSFFDHRKTPPTPIQPGDELVFSSITKAEFEAMETKETS